METYLSGHGCQTGISDWHETIAQKEREEWQPNFALPHAELARAAEAQGAEIGE